MRVPLSWLKEFTPIDLDPRDPAGLHDFANELSMLGMNVEHVDTVEAAFPGVVVARVAAIEAIKGADRIRKVVVDAGAVPTTVVCGAFNFEVGDYVPFATVGARLPGGLEIGRREMRGVVSEGMICSGRELGLSTDASGIFVLFSPPKGRGAPAVVPLGMALVDYLGLEHDAVFDLDIEPNRPDLLSMVGVARDVAAHRRIPFEVPPIGVEETGLAANRLVSIAIEAPDACRRFVRASHHRGGGASRSTRRAAAADPVGDAADQRRRRCVELHDARTWPADPPLRPRPPRWGGFRVRLAHQGERLVTLDGVERVLGEHRNRHGETEPVDDLLICDANDVAVGLAGIMGGASSEISDSTTNVVLESADFTQAFVGETASRQDLRSEASDRAFAGRDRPRRIGPGGGTCRAAHRCGPRGARRHAPIVARGIADAVGTPPVSPPIYLRTDRVNDLLGTELDRRAVRSLLAPIGFSAGKAPKGLAVSVPSFRPTSGGKSTSSKKLRAIMATSGSHRRCHARQHVGSLTAYQKDRRNVTRLLADFGAAEASTSAIVDPQKDELGGEGLQPLTLVNPVVPRRVGTPHHTAAGLARGATPQRRHAQRFGAVLRDREGVPLPSGGGGGADRARTPGRAARSRRRRRAHRHRMPASPSSRAADRLRADAPR